MSSYCGLSLLFSSRLLFPASLANTEIVLKLYGSRRSPKKVQTISAYLLFFRAGMNIYKFLSALLSFLVCFRISRAHFYWYLGFMERPILSFLLLPVTFFSRFCFFGRPKDWHSTRKTYPAATLLAYAAFGVLPSLASQFPIDTLPRTTRSFWNRIFYLSTLVAWIIMYYMYILRAEFCLASSFVLLWPVWMPIQCLESTRRLKLFYYFFVSMVSVSALKLFVSACTLSLRFLLFLLGSFLCSKSSAGWGLSDAMQWHQATPRSLSVVQVPLHLIRR